MRITGESPSFATSSLSIVLVVPQAGRRKALAQLFPEQQATIAREFDAYPSIDALSECVAENCDVVIMDVDHDAERALDLVENVCAENRSVTVMIYTGRNNSDLLVRCMRAGAREILTDPLTPAAAAEALVRTAARRGESRRQKKTAGKVLVFVGAKGGCGVTTIASNVALAVMRESGQKATLVDLDVQLGDAALTLALTPEYSIVDALRHADRLDTEFLASLLTHHSSGLSVLAATDQYGGRPLLGENVVKIVRLLRDDSAYVIVDAGADPSGAPDELFELADAIYVVSEVTVPALRNANRLLAYLSSIGVARKVETILNRFEPGKLEIDDARIAKALGEQARWKLPNDYATVRRAQNTGEPLAYGPSALAKALAQVARAICGVAPEPVRKKKFGLFG